MKNMIGGILLSFVAFTASAIYGGQPSSIGVAGVEVMVRQSPSKHVVTNARGTFAFDALPAGSYTLAIRAQKAKDTKKASTSKVTVADSYSIKIDGTKRPVNQSLTSDKLLAGLDIAVEVGSGGKIRGQVLAGGTKKMVWIPAGLGSHMSGHWVEADSKEASRFNRLSMSPEDVQNTLRPPDPHQEGFPGGPGLSPPAR